MFAIRSHLHAISSLSVERIITTLQILGEFELNLEQVAFTGARFLCTLAFFRAVRTDLFIYLKVWNDIRDILYHGFSLIRLIFAENEFPSAEEYCFKDY